jgi:hypothetical protein
MPNYPIDVMPANVQAGLTKFGSDAWKPKYAQGQLPRFRGADTKVQGGGFTWRDKVGLFFSRGNDNIDGNIEFTWSSDGLLTWSRTTESNPPPVGNTTSKRNQGTQDPTKIPFQVTNAPHVTKVIGNRLFILNRGDNDATDGSQFYRKWSKAIYRYEKRFLQIKTTDNNNWLRVYWTDHGLRGDGVSATSDMVDVWSMIRPGSSGNAIGGMGANSVAGKKKVKVINRDEFEVQSSVSAGSVTGAFEWFHFGVTFYPYGWVEDRYMINGFSKSWEEWFLHNIGLVTPVNPITSITLIQGMHQTGSGKWIMPVSGNFKAICQVKDFVDDLAGSWVQGEYIERATGDWINLPNTIDADGINTEITCWPAPTATYPDRIIGFTRTQTNPYEYKANGEPHASEFFWSNDAGVTIQQGRLKIPVGARCTFPSALGDDGYIYAFISERLTRWSGDDDVRAAYLVRGKLDDVLNATVTWNSGSNSGQNVLDKGINAFKIYNIGEVDLTASAEDLVPAEDAHPSYWGTPTVGAPEPAAGSKIYGPGRSSEASRSGLPTVVKFGSWIIWFFLEQELGAFIDGEWDYSNSTAGFQGDIKSTWNMIRWFAIDTRDTTTQGDFPLSKYGVLAQSGTVK